jgi:alkaline phosphatase D
MRRWLIAAILLAASACSRPPSASPLPYVLLVSLDGFRYDYVNLYGALHLKRLGEQGVRAKGLIPVYPSSTFPNHYSIVTGLYPEHHGIVDNTFFDPQRNRRYHYAEPATGGDGSWYGGTPLWVLAEQQGVRTATFFWPGSDAEIQGVRPSEYRHYDASVPNAERVRQVIAWFAKPEPERPHLVTLYFSDVDTAGHRYGPSATETEQAVAELDQTIGSLLRGLEATGVPVNVFIVSDHGMLEVQGTVSVGAAADFAGFEIAPEGGSQIMLYSADPVRVRAVAERLQSRDPRYTAHVRQSMPELLHYRDNWRIGDVVVLATAPVILYIDGLSSETLGSGAHGYDPRRFPQMQGIFYARGPDLKSGLVLEPFENVDVYPVIARLLRLKPRGHLDGSDALLSILQDQPAAR